MPVNESDLVDVCTNNPPLTKTSVAAMTSDDLTLNSTAVLERISCYLYISIKSCIELARPGQYIFSEIYFVGDDTDNYSWVSTIGIYEGTIVMYGAW